MTRGRADDEPEGSLLNRRALVVLLEELDGDRGARARFLRAFRGSAACRLQRVVRATEARQSKEAVIAVLSLRTSASMVGAQALADRLVGVEGLIREDEWSAASAAAAGLTSLVTRTTTALEPFCDDVPGGGDR